MPPDHSAQAGQTAGSAGQCQVRGILGFAEGRTCSTPGLCNLFDATSKSSFLGLNLSTRMISLI